MSQYRKLIVALVGALVMVGVEVFGWSQLAGMEDSIVTAVVTLLTAAGVWAVPNTTTPTAEAQDVAKEAAKEVLARLRGDRRR